MAARISEVFAIEIEQFIKILNQIDYHLFEIENAITNEFYTKRDVIKELRYTSELVEELKGVFSLIIEQAKKYRPSNALLFNYLKIINEYLKKLNLSIQIAEVAYERDPDYGIKGVYKDVTNSRRYIKLIKKELDTAIQQRVFA